MVYACHWGSNFLENLMIHLQTNPAALQARQDLLNTTQSLNRPLQLFGQPASQALSTGLVTRSNRGFVQRQIYNNQPPVHTQPVFYIEASKEKDFKEIEVDITDEIKKVPVFMWFALAVFLLRRK